MCFLFFYLFFCYYLFCFFFNDTATTEIYTLSLHDALPILQSRIRKKEGAKTPIPFGFLQFCTTKDLQRERRRCRGVEEEVAHSEPVRLEAGFILIWRSVQWAVVFNSLVPSVVENLSAEKE